MEPGTAEPQVEMVNDAGQPLNAPSEPETGIEAVTGLPPGLTLAQRIARWLGLGGETHTERLGELTEMIERAPDVATHYVLRGELLLEMGEAELAQADFQRGLELATEAYGRSAWGLIDQITRDRAEMGLEHAVSRLKRRSAYPTGA